MLASEQLPMADEITVFGETETAMFAALWLAEHGKKVSLVSPADEVGIDTNDMQRGHLIGLLKSLGVSVSTGSALPVDGTVVMATARIASQSGFWAASKIGEML
jgi:2,4-dienoyl-CoA reductase (NADPH2)